MAYNNLTVGASGKEVEQLQKALLARGYDLGSSGVDSIYGEKTAAAVRKYQQDNGLQIDGIAGQQTLSHLYGSTADTPEEPDLLTPEKPTFTDPYAQQLQALYDKVTKYPEFSYNINEDALFAQYRDSYTQAGRLAMEDAMGRSAAYTGGYGSSYSQAVGQQAYREQLQKLYDTVPRLEQRAYDRHQQQKEDLLEQYALTWQKAQQSYDRYRQELADYEKEKAQAYDRLQTLILETGYGPTKQELADAGMSQAQAQAFLKAYTAQHAPKQTGAAKPSAQQPEQPEAPYVDLEALGVSGYAALQKKLKEQYEKEGDGSIRRQLEHWLQMGYINEAARANIFQWLQVLPDENMDYWKMMENIGKIGLGVLFPSLKEET